MKNSYMNNLELKDKPEILDTINSRYNQNTLEENEHITFFNQNNLNNLSREITNVVYDSLDNEKLI